MIRNQIVAALAACTLTAGTVHAQTATAPVRVVDGRAQVVSGAVEARITPNRPYSAEASTEMTQVLADGNRISRTSVTRVYRDSAGRTRRETHATDGTLASIAISDPVAHASFTLHPDRKVAFKAGSTVGMPSGRGVPPQVVPGAGASQQVVDAATGSVRAIAPPVVVPPGAAGGRGAMTAARSGGPDNPNVRSEDLGTQNIEGVLATGTRTTTVVPAGQIGNTQEIRVVSERWFSEELQVLVMTRHSDPRSGETVYRLRNIVRADPDPALFTVPSDYTVVDRFIRKPE